MKFYKSGTEAFIFKIGKVVNGEEINYSILTQLCGMEGASMLMLRNNESPITNNGKDEDFEKDIVVDGAFDATLNAEIKKVFTGIDVVLVIDNGSTDANNDFDQKFIKEDIEVIEEIKNTLTGIGIDEGSLTAINTALKIGVYNG